jgi:glycogen debranching enzyme
LIPAFELDSALLRFSASIADPATPLPSNIKTEADLKKVMTELRRVVFVDIRLWEFYVVDVLTSLKELESSIIAKVKYSPDLFIHQNLKKLTLKEKARVLREAALTGADEHGGRHHKKITTKIAMSFMAALLGQELSASSPLTVDAICDEYKAILNEVNLDFYKAYDEDVETIVSNVENRVKYIRLDEHGPKLGPVTEE